MTDRFAWIARTRVALARLLRTSLACLVGVSIAVVPGESRAASPGLGHGIIACAGADRVLRARPAGVGCGVGETALPLVAGAPDLSILDDDEGAAKAAGSPSGSTDWASDLQRRIDALRNGPLFTVIDKEGHHLFEVRPEGVLAYNKEGVPVVAMRATPSGGLFRVTSGDGTLASTLGATDVRAGIRISEGGADRIRIGRQDTGRYSFTMLPLSGKGNPVAGIGEAIGSSGATIVGTVTGSPRASMSALDGKGRVAILDGDNVLASLTTDEAESGLLAIGNGTDMGVTMSVNENRYGVVKTGPAGGLPLLSTSGLPGSYFLGCAGGRSCKPY